jgi:uncharacterized protein (TIGR03032 family)
MTAQVHLPSSLPPDRPAPPEQLPGGTRAVVDVHCEPSTNLAPLLERLGVSVILSAPHSGNVIILATAGGQLILSFHTFERPMGLAVSRDTLAVCTHNEVWLARNASDIASKLEPRGRYDGCYLTRAARFTGDIQAHEAAWVNGELWLVNTLFSCLCTLHERYSFAPRWRPPFITRLVPEDRCHLNGLAPVDGQPRYVTAVSETDGRQGWRQAKGTSGCLIDIASGQTIVRGLCMPHSPRFAGGRVYLDDSGTGRLVAVDVENGRMETVASLPGFTRGLAVYDSLAFVGLSRIRPTSDMNGLPIAAQAERLRCGLAVVDLHSGQIMAQLDISSPVDEIFDIQLLPGVRCPFVAGPFVDRDLGHPVWTMPPQGSRAKVV